LLDDRHGNQIQEDSYVEWLQELAAVLVASQVHLQKGKPADVLTLWLLRFTAELALAWRSSSTVKLTSVALDMEKQLLPAVRAQWQVLAYVD
jgi:hypothetical protein